jgi:RNA polymerase sigma factor (TIGR02999 family)
MSFSISVHSARTALAGKRLTFRSGFAYSFLVTDVTQLLTAIDQGDPHAARRLLPLVYAELRQLAATKLTREPPGQTIDATSLVHEAYLRLVPGKPAQEWDGRRHFFAAAAEAMRRILVERARRRRRHRHGGGRQRVELDAHEPEAPARPDELLALDESMDRLAQTNPQAAELVKLRFFAGCSNAEAASVLGISPRKANQIWAYARAWLLEDMGPGAD